MKSYFSENHFARRFSIPVIALISILMASCFLYYLVLLGNFLSQLSSILGIIIFTVLAASAYVLGQRVLQFAKWITKEAKLPGSSYFTSINTVATIIFYVTAAVVAAVVVESLVTLQYHVGLYVAAVSISFSLAAVSTGVISYKCLSWYRSSGDVFTLVFAIAFAVGVAAFLGVALPNSLYFFSLNPFQTEGQNTWVDTSEPYYPSLKKNDDLFNAYQLTLLPTRVGFFAFWAIAILLARNYYHEIGKLKFLSIASLPVIAYAIVTLNSAAGLESSFPLFAALLIPIGGTSAGIFIAIILATTSGKMRRMRQDVLATYLAVAGFGLVPAFLSLTPSVHVIDRTHTVFPPYGVISHVFAPLSAYIFSLGFYFSATTISKDIKIRKSLRQQVATHTAKLLDNIGTAQMEHQIRQTVEKVAKEQSEVLEKETGVQQSVSEEEMQKYMSEVIEEMKRIRNNAQPFKE